MPGVSNASPTLRESAQTHRQRLLAAMPVAERRINCAGMSTAVAEGGQGTPLVLLHGPFGHVAHWMKVMPALTRDHRVIAADLPGHGSSETSVELDADRILTWLRELIEQTTQSPPWLVGQTLGAAIAARFAMKHGARIRGLVLINPLAFAPFNPQPPFAKALGEFFAEPNEQTLRELWTQCVYDLPSVQRRFAPHWESFESYNLQLAQDPSLSSAVRTMMQGVAAPLTDSQLAQIRLPTLLICGRHDRVTPLQVSRSASERFGWPLRIIEEAADEPPLEAPDAFAKALSDFLGGRA